MNSHTLDLHAGDIVEVLGQDEILATLDNSGCYEGVPFMPEMFRYCGERRQVSKRAHKVCDFVTPTGNRRLPNAVILEDTRCDGSAHGNCEALCTIFWKEAWLKRVATRSGNATPLSLGPTKPKLDPPVPIAQRVYESCLAQSPSGDTVYRCQATELPQFTHPMSPWDLRQYVEDYRSGNVRSIGAMLSSVMFRVYDNLINLGIGWGPILRWLYDAFQKTRGGLPYPGRAGNIPAGSQTPASSLGLKPGELVRVKSYHQILATLDTTHKNRGMGFSAEMVPYCNQIFRVLSLVTQIIDEKTGKMLTFKNPCIILDGVACQARYGKGMIFCPRATYSYWREIWLERVEPSAQESQQGISMRVAPVRFARQARTMERTDTHNG